MQARVAFEKRTKPSALGREYLLTKGHRALKSPDETATLLGDRSALEAAVLAERGYGDWVDRLFVGNVPAWTLKGAGTLALGPQTEPLTADSMRFANEGQGARIVILGGQQRQSGSIELTLSSTIPADALGPRPEGAPTTAVLMGLSDINPPSGCDPIDKGKILPVPTTGYGAVLDGNTVKLAAIVEVRGDEQCGSRDYAFNKFELGEVWATLPAKGKQVAIAVAVDGDTLTVTVNGKTAEHTLSDPVVGFSGVAFAGQGFMQISELTVR